MHPDESYMALALKCAASVRGLTSPNPPVGAVLVNNNRVVSKGSTQPAGGPHAEIQAIQSAGNQVHGGILYVTLEPCCHYGRTPPCTEAIISAGIHEVHIATSDPNPMVSSKGIKRLESAGIKVNVGELKYEADQMIEYHTKFILEKIPFVTAKFAMTLDGRIATKTNDSKWISGEASRDYVHKLRSCSDAILVGINTLLHDDPKLTARLGDGSKKYNQPMRVIVDSHLKIPLDAKIFSEPGKNLIATLVRSEKSKEIEDLHENTEIVFLPEVDGRLDLNSLIKELGEREITSLLVEGGSEIFGTFFDLNLVDKFLVFVAPKLIGGSNSISPIGGDGVDLISNATALTDISFEKFDDDFLITGYVDRR